MSGLIEQRARAGDTVIRTADIAGDAFAHQTLIAALYFLHPFWLGNQPTTNGDQIGIAGSEDIFGDFWRTNVAGDDRRLMEFVAYRAREVALPAVFQRHLVDLQVQVIVLRGRDVNDVDFVLAQFEDAQRIFQRVAAL